MGKRYPKKYPQMKMVYPGQRKKFLVLIIVLIGIFLTVASLAKIVPVTSMISYVDQEPYEDQEKYIEAETYSEEECTQEEYEYSISGKSFHSYPDAPQIFIGEFYVKNEEDVDGEFSFKYNFLTEKEGDLITNPIKKNITAGGTQYFGFFYTAEEDESVVSKGYVIHEIPTKETCDTVTKERNVTKYRTVTKYRDVSRQKPETSYATLFEFLFVK